jgi:hypothetical protein
MVGCELNNNERNSNDNKVTQDMAYNGINIYCHKEYDWKDDNSTIMYVEMGNETESEYQVIFRSYTGSFVYFYVDKTNGSTKVVEYEPVLNITSEVGSINIFDYLNNK